jgi:hypothetical protein
MNYSAPYISSGPIGKDPNDTAIMMHRFNQAKSADWENRRRGLRNMAAYLNDVLPNYLKNALQRENRTEQNYNLLMFIVRGHVGNVLMNWFDPKFVGRQDESIDAIEALTKVYLAQKEYYNYKASAMGCYENGYIYRGVEQLMLDRPSSNPRSWGLKFVNMRPDLVIFDQNVNDDCISRSAQEAWIINYMSPAKIIRLFGLPGTRVEREILLRLQREGKSAPAFDMPTPHLYDNIDQNKFGNNCRVVEWLHIEYEKKIVQYLKNGTLIPSSGYEIGTVEDVLFKQEWAASYGYELSDDKILTMKDDLPCMYSTPFMPEQGILLDDRKDFRQLNGRLPLYAWSFIQKNGMSFGLVDYEWDIQQDFNRREMAKTKIITKTPIAGKPWIRRDMFDSESDFQNALKSYTDPSVPLVIPENAPPVPEGFGILPGAQFPPSILEDQNFKLALSERIGMLPPALQGRSERSADTGVAIGRKVVEANTMMKQESTTVIQHENDKHEDWVILAVKLFGNPININRPFQSADGKEKVVINEAVGIDAVGNTIMRNDIGSLKRVNVIISQSKENDFISQVRLEKAVGSLQVMPPSETNTLHRAALEYAVINSQDFGSDEDKERAKRLSELQLEIVEKGAMLQLKTLDNQLQGPQAGPGGGGPQGQMEAPVQGSGAPPGTAPPQQMQA